MGNQMLRKRRPWFVHAVLPAYLGAAAAYLVWRATLTIGWGQWYLWLLWSSEFVSVVFTIAYLATSRRLDVPIRRAPPAGKTADIFIPTYNEPEDIVKMTTIGALHVRGARKVFVLDDGCRVNIHAMATALGAEYVPRSDNTHAKAGNMNAGILHSDAEFMLFLDCDHVPQPQIIERMLGYFDDPRLAFVQTPQLFYNVDSFQFRRTHSRPLWNEQTMFYEAIQPAKNHYNAAFFCGSGALIRRAAIDAIGGFATGTATEDIHTSLRLHARGWHSLFLDEQLAHGIAPVDIVEYHKQRTRWGAGSLGLLFRSADSPLRARGLSVMQRICYVNSTASFTFGLQRIFYIALPFLLLLLLPFGTPQDVPTLLYILVTLSFLAMSGLAVWLVSDGTYHPLLSEQYNIANIFSHVKALRGIIQVQKKFSVSAKKSVKNNRSAIEPTIRWLCAALLLADAFALSVWFLAGHPMAELAGNMLGLALFWNTFNLAYLLPLAIFLARSSRKAIPPCAIAVPLQPASLDDVHARRPIQITGLDLNGATARIFDPGVERGDYVLALDAARRPLRIPAAVAEVRPTVEGWCDLHLTFGKLAPEVATALTLHLFHDVVPNTLRFGKRGAPGRFASAGVDPSIGRIPDRARGR